jgi:5'-methylthioinosine phosphorylase
VAELIAIIGGTGLSNISSFNVEDIKPAPTSDTPYGDPSGQLEMGQISGRPVVFLARHGTPHQLAPHKVNYRANIWALKQLKVSRIIAINAVGSITRDLELADLVITDQIIDYSYGREHSYFDLDVQHIDFTYPYDEKLRQSLVESAFEVKKQHEAFGFAAGGVYGCTQGPRLETAAEIRRMARDGCDVVGMTAMPEAALARELDIPYAGISMVVNKAAGIDGNTVTIEEIRAIVEVAVDRVGLLLNQYLGS